MKTVSMPDLFARLAIALVLPPLDWLAYQIHMPSPSKADGEGAYCVSAIGGAMVGAGGCLAAACAGRGTSAAARAAANVVRRRRVTENGRTLHFYHGFVNEVPILWRAGVKWGASSPSPPFESEVLECLVSLWWSLSRQ
jgi:hypothetical protein